MTRSRCINARLRREGARVRPRVAGIAAEIAVVEVLAGGAALRGGVCSQGHMKTPGHPAVIAHKYLLAGVSAS